MRASGGFGTAYPRARPRNCPPAYVRAAPQVYVYVPMHVPTHARCSPALHPRRPQWRQAWPASGRASPRQARSRPCSTARRGGCRPCWRGPGPACEDACACARVRMTRQGLRGGRRAAAGQHHRGLVARQALPGGHKLPDCLACCLTAWLPAGDQRRCSEGHSPANRVGAPPSLTRRMYRQSVDTQYPVDTV